MKIYSTSSFLSGVALCLLTWGVGCKSTLIDNSVVDATQNIIRPIAVLNNWNKHLNPSHFENIERLGKWTGGLAKVAPKTSPSAHFTKVSKNGITNTSKPIHLYVVTHGWAPTYDSTVKKANYQIQWWSDNARNSEGLWASPWFWEPTASLDKSIMISETGLIQQIIAYERKQHPSDSVIVLAYSWIDNSATSALPTDARISQARTNLNGLRMAQAIVEAVGTDFLGANGQNELHLIGHSHGSKVATMAAMTLQNQGHKVDQLTILDAPEAGLNPGLNLSLSLEIDAANLLGYYLSQMVIGGSAPQSGKTPIFVDNYISEFGVAYRGNEQLDNIVNVGLYPEKIYAANTSPADELSLNHSYSGIWYAGAAIGARKTGHQKAGLAWPSTPANAKTTWYQVWEDKTAADSAKYQWALAKGSVSNVKYDTYQYLIRPTTLTTTGAPTGPVAGNPADGLTFSSWAGGTGAKNSSYNAKVDLTGAGVYGLAFDINWEGPADGDYFVVTVDSEVGTEEIIMVFDGKTMMEGGHKVSFNTYMVGGKETKVHFHFLPAAGKASNRVMIKDFKQIKVENYPTK